MPTTLLLCFPLGRYHANPWGRHVNEGEVEIPPSPWRLLRALYSVWQTRAPELTAETVHELLAHLAEPPTFHVPRHTISHTRHYYPDTRDGTDRTFDAFAVFDPDVPLVVSWSRELPSTLRTALERLSASLPYFGRADSPCVASVGAGWPPSGEHETWEDVSVAERVLPDAVTTAVLAPELPLNVATLLARPLDVRRGGLLFPVGSRFVGYQRVRDTVPPRRVRGKPDRSPTSVRFDVMQAALPPDVDALVYTDLLRQAALSKLNAPREDRPRTVLGGRNADDTKMEGHEHAHYLPVFKDRRITSFMVWTPAELDQRELAAVLRVRRLFSPWEKDWQLHVRPAGQGAVADIGAGLVGPARVWQSVTPFVPSRYPGRRDWGEFGEAELRREVDNHKLPALTDIRPMAERDWREFVRYRPTQRRTRDPQRRHGNRGGCFVKLAFTEDVHGPVALGFLSHFGLGLFEPVR